MNLSPAWIEAIPAIARILIIFGLVLLAMRHKWSLGNAFAGGTVALGLVFGMGPWAIVRSAGAALVQPKTISLSVVIALILVLSHTLEESGQMARLLDSFKGLIRRPKINLVIFPALIGLLPMPGGAIFSAPMVKNLGVSHRLSPSQLSYINYWFRHIWEYWWPLYPGILLTTTLANVDLWRLVSVTVPLTLVAIFIGYRPLKGAIAAAEGAGQRRSMGPFLKELAPIGAVIVLSFIFGLLFSRMLPAHFEAIAKELGLILALVLAIVWVWQVNAMAWRERWAIIKSPALVKMVYMITAILLFKAILEQSRAVDQVSQEMLRWHIPLVPIAILLPLLVGTVSGITIAFVGTTFPILISLIQGFGQEPLLLPYLMLALAAGFVGVLVSPLHLCLLVSNEYFKTTLIPIYRLMRTPLIALLTSALIYFYVLRY
ncbi:MAG: DUF401 family protein, partial [Desulfobacteraceae bacterium]|nr:DUF401 family protein [Desulfobacteraceae bacterium]